MGIVYLARNRLLDRLEAIKVLPEAVIERPAGSDRFVREIRTAARLSHLHVVQTYGAFRMGRSMAMVMEYVPGENLAQVVQRRGPLPISDAVRYVQQAALGLQHAADQGLVHRDIKPTNLVLAQGVCEYVKILDFGLAKARSEQVSGEDLTSSDQILGTPAYMAPEQVQCAARADIRADLYSLGCTLYFLLTGKLLFPGRSQTGQLLAHQTEQPAKLGDARPDAPEGLAKVLAKLLDKSPIERYQTPSDVVAALQPFCEATLDELAEADSRSAPVTALMSSRSQQAPTGHEISDDRRSRSLLIPAKERSDSRNRRIRNVLWLSGVGSAVLLIAGYAFQYGLHSSAITSPFVVRTRDDSPVCAMLRPPDQAMRESLDRMKDVFVAIGHGKSSELDPTKEFNLQMDDKLWLPSGTRVAFIVQGQLADPIAESKLQLKIGADFREQFANLANAANVKVRVLEGPAQGKEVWVARNLVQREPANHGP